MLRREMDAFRQFTEDPLWMAAPNSEMRKTITRGLTFVMLNLGPEVDQDAAWDLYHHAMDEYHDTCDEQGLAY
jgi:hypothetical protein